VDFNTSFISITIFAKRNISMLNGRSQYVIAKLNTFINKQNSIKKAPLAFN